MALRASIVVAVLVAVLCAGVQAQNVPPTVTNIIVQSLDGRMADFNNANQQIVNNFAGSTAPRMSADPDPKPAFPGNSAVFYLPSQRSASLAPAVAAGSQVVTLVAYPGRVRPFPNDLTSIELGLANAGDDCSDGVTGADFQIVGGNARQVGNQIFIDFTLPTSNTLSTAWNRVEAEVESMLGRNGPGYKLCISALSTAVNGGQTFTSERVWKWTGLYISVAWDCDVPGGDPDQQCSNMVPSNLTPFNVLSPLEFLSLNGAQVRTKCCKATVGTLQVGVCVNPNAQSCCGGNPYFPGQKCCSTQTEVVVFDANPCPCRAVSETTDSTGRTVNTDCMEPMGTTMAGGMQADKCCLPSLARFPEFRDDNTTSNRVENGFSGFCYREGGPLKCCDTGEVYDPGASQCCVINGVQSASEPCVCQTDAHCAGGETDFHQSTKRCCRGTFPDVPTARETEVCNAYANYPFFSPSFPGLNGRHRLAHHQRCFGMCIDTNFQICCNGVACARNFERCCNTTCCNRFSATCRFGIAAGAQGNPWNSANFRQTVTRCSSVYFLHGLRSFFIFALPGFLLLSTLLGLAVVLVFANKASNRSYSFIESAMILLSINAILFALPTFFSPAFKYGVLVVLVGLITILSAAARVRSLNVLALVALVVAIIYVFDPFTGNAYLNLTGFRTLSQDLTGRTAAGFQRVPGQPDDRTNGLLHLITAMWREGQQFCVDFYDYFRLDDQLLDKARFDNPAVTTYGYCNRGWVFALLIFEIIMMSTLVILTIVTLIALLLRFRKQADLAPVELEVKML